MDYKKLFEWREGKKHQKEYDMDDLDGNDNSDSSSDEIGDE